jgi:membrane protein DedA with SNARE-associated domain
MTPQLPGVLGSLAPLLERYGYLAVVGLVFTEGFGLPAPGQTILVVAGVYAGAGHLNIVFVALCGFFAATIGDNIGYLIGKAGGRRLVLRFGRYIFLTPERLDKAETFFARHGGKVVASARFIDGLRQVNGIVAGLAKMPWWRFLTFNAIGGALWVGVWTSIGYFAGDRIAGIYEQYKRYETYVLIALGVLAVAAIAWWAWKRRRKRATNTLTE